MKAKPLLSTSIELEVQFFDVDSMRKGTFDNFTVSCKLPPQTALGGIFVESY